MTSTDTYQLKWHSHSSHLNGSVAALLRSEKFTDVVLCTMDGSQIPAHKFILSSCSIYLSNLFEGQRNVTRMGGMLYVVLPSEISTKALKIIVEYMYKGETTVSNDILDTVLKAGEVLKIRGLWRQAEESQTDTPEKVVQAAPVVNKTVTKFNAVQQPGVTRPMFIGPPKLVFIKTTEGGAQATIRPGAPKGQTILVTQAPSTDKSKALPANSQTVTLISSNNETIDSPRVLTKHSIEKKYGKRQKVDGDVKDDNDNADQTSDASKQKDSNVNVQIKDEPEWEDASSIEEEERSIAEMFQSEMSVKAEPIDDDIDVEESLMYSPLSCELCAEVFTVPAAWVRHVEGHARHDHAQPRARKRRAGSDDSDKSMALLRCDLCQKHFPNPAEWVRHIQSTHSETEKIIISKILSHNQKKGYYIKQILTEHKLELLERTTY